jgi:FkbM family methyltransferase
MWNLFPNVKSILKMGSPLSSYKLLLINASRTRPWSRTLCMKLLQPFIKNGEVSLRYRCYDRFLRTFVRMSDLENDLLGALELSIRDIYNLGSDRSFEPDLVIDGGGNIGLFTLRAAASTSSFSASPVRFVICEPLPRNVEQIQRHLDVNKVQAEIMRACLGGTRRSIPFYCREAIHSSFDPLKPYISVMDMPVCILQDAIGSYPANRILIKLDIEGMEIEALDSFVPLERRPVYIVGELHDFSANAPRLERIFEQHSWIYECCRVADNNAIFRACSPAALPLLPSMANMKPPVRPPQ